MGCLFSKGALHPDAEAAEKQRLQQEEESAAAEAAAAAAGSAPARRGSAARAGRERACRAWIPSARPASAGRGKFQRTTRRGSKTGRAQSRRPDYERESTSTTYEREKRERREKRGLSLLSNSGGSISRPSAHRQQRSDSSARTAGVRGQQPGLRCSPAAARPPPPPPPPPLWIDRPTEKDLPASGHSEHLFSATLFVTTFSRHLFSNTFSPPPFLGHPFPYYT